MAFFSSVLTERFSESSDIDVLVQFNTGARLPGYFDLARMEGELLALFGRKVDLRTPGSTINAADRVRLRHVLEAAREVGRFMDGRTKNDWQLMLSLFP